MSFSTVQTIETLNEFKQKVGNRLVYINDPVNFDTANQGKEFIEGILARTTGSEIKFQDYNEMMKYMNSIDYLERVISMPDIDASSGKCIGYINKLRKDNVLSQKIAQMERDAQENYNKNPTGNFKMPKFKVIWTNKSIVADYNTWLNKAKQIYIPGDYQVQANKIISKYLGFVGSLSAEHQMQAKAFLDNLKFAETLFKTDKELNDKVMVSLFGKLENKTKKYGPNIFFSILDLDTEEYTAISKMAFWLNMPLNAMFTISDQMVGQGLNQILSGQLAKQKSDQAKDKKNKEDDAKKEQEKKEKEKTEAKTKEPPQISEVDSLRQRVDDFVKKTEELNNITGELNNLNNPPTIENYTDTDRRAAEVLNNYIPKAEDGINSLINASL